MSGTLQVHLLGARRLRDAAVFGIQDPYVIVKYSGAEQQSKTHTDGGVTPKWNEMLVFDAGAGRDQKLEIAVKNKGVFRHDLIGRAEVSLVEAFEKGQDRKTVQLLTKGERARGEIDIVLKFSPFVENAEDSTVNSSSVAPAHRERYVALNNLPGFQESFGGMNGKAAMPPVSSTQPAQLPYPVQPGLTSNGFLQNSRLPAENSPFVKAPVPPPAESSSYPSVPGALPPMYPGSSSSSFPSGNVPFGQSSQSSSGSQTSFPPYGYQGPGSSLPPSYYPQQTPAALPYKANPHVPYDTNPRPSPPNVGAAYPVQRPVQEPMVPNPQEGRQQPGSSASETHSTLGQYPQPTASGQNAPGAGPRPQALSLEERFKALRPPSSPAYPNISYDS